MVANVGHSHDSYLYCKLRRCKIDILLSRSKARCCKGLGFTHSVFLRWVWRRWTDSSSHTCRLVLLSVRWIRQSGLYTEWVPFTEPAESPSKIIKFHLVAILPLRHDAKVAAETCGKDVLGKVGPFQSAMCKADEKFHP